MEKIEFVQTDEPATTGWYIIQYDEGSEYNYDAQGPYETKEEAERIQREYPLN